MPRKKPKERAAAGGGSIFFRSSDKRWCTAFYLGVVDGKPKFWRAYSKTEAEAIKKRDDYIVTRQTAELVGTSNQLLADYLADWLKSVKLSRKHNTWKYYANAVNTHIVPKLGNLTLTEITAQHVDELLADLQEVTYTTPKSGVVKSLTPRHIRGVRDVLRAALNRAIRRRLLKFNAAAVADAPSAEHKEAVPLDYEDVLKFLAAVKGHPLEALYVLAVALGLRQGEILGLRWSDVDLDRAELRTARQLVLHEGGRYELDETKTYKSNRVIPLPKFVVQALAERKQRQVDQWKAAAGRWVGNTWDLVFTTEIGTPINRHNLKRQYHAFLKAAGVPLARFHDLRHTTASLLFAEHMDSKQVQELLGHKKLATTMDIYTHIIRRVQKETTDKMESLLGPNRPVKNDR